MRDLREAVLQALAFTMRDFATVRDFDAARSVLQDALRAALDAQEEHDTDCHMQGVCQRSGYSIGGPKPLTEDEIERLIQTYSGYGQDDFVSVTRAVERAHGIKGGNDE